VDPSSLMHFAHYNDKSWPETCVEFDLLQTEALYPIRNSAADRESWPTWCQPLTLTIPQLTDKAQTSWGWENTGMTSTLYKPKSVEIVPIVPDGFWHCSHKSSVSIHTHHVMSASDWCQTREDGFHWVKQNKEQPPQKKCVLKDHWVPSLLGYTVWKEIYESCHWGDTISRGTY